MILGFVPTPRHLQVCGSLRPAPVQFQGSPAEQPLESLSVGCVQGGTSSLSIILRREKRKKDFLSFLLIQTLESGGWRGKAARVYGICSPTQALREDIELGCYWCANSSPTAFSDCRQAMVVSAPLSAKYIKLDQYMALQ